MPERAPQRDPQEILEERARRLARPLASPKSSALEVLSFGVSRERYAVESRFVFAVLRLANLVMLPGALAPVAGLTRWRGEILTLIDLRTLVGATAHALDDLGFAIVLGGSSAEFGVLADVIDGMSLVDPARLHPIPSIRNATPNAVILGVTEEGIQLVDASALIAGQSHTSDTALPPLDISISPSTHRTQ